MNRFYPALPALFAALIAASGCQVECALDGESGVAPAVRQAVIHVNLTGADAQVFALQSVDARLDIQGYGLRAESAASAKPEFWEGSISASANVGKYGTLAHAYPLALTFLAFEGAAVEVSLPANESVCQRYCEIKVPRFCEGSCATGPDCQATCEAAETPHCTSTCLAKGQLTARDEIDGAEIALAGDYLNGSAPGPALEEPAGRHAASISEDGTTLELNFDLRVDAYPPLKF